MTSWHMQWCPWKKYVHWKNLDPKGHILYKFIYIKLQEEVNLLRQKIDLWIVEEGEEHEEWLLMGKGCLLGMIKILKSIVVMVSQLCEGTK